MNVMDVGPGFACATVAISIAAARSVAVIIPFITVYLPFV
jgi:hypothetical protein